MNIKQFVAELSQQGVNLWVEGEQLRANAPKGVLTSETRDLLVKNKAELILLLDEKSALAKFTGGIATDTDLPLIKAERSQNLPLSFAQEQLWLLNQLEPDNPFYNEQVVLKLHGKLNVVALEQSLNKIIARHEVLRTNFRTINEQPVQVIADSLILSVPIVDLTELPASEREIACQQLATTEANRPFDLASSPLIRASVVKLTEVEHALILTMHHIIFDGWSMGVLMGELATIYSALCNNLSPELPELPIQYADFAIWQRQWLQTQVLQRQLDYWKQLLKNAPTLLELPTDRPRPAIQTYRGAIQYVEFSNELSQALANFSRQEGATLFMTLFTAYVTLLYRYTGSDDVVVGTPIANRDRLELEGLIGCFLNTLVLRTDLSGNPTFQQLLSRVRQLTLEAYAHPLPFEELVKALQPQRYLSHTPLFQVMFVLQNAPISQLELAGLTISSLPAQSATAKFDLTLSIQNSATGLVGVWQYNADLFDAGTIERMSGHFQTLLEGIVANPQKQISQLPLLTEVEQQQLLVEWNNTQIKYPFDKCIHQLFEEQVQLTPDAVAVVFENQQLTYGQLNCRANQLAHYLQTLGVKPDVLVGICVERSLEMIVGLLAILKAGGAYVPLDPEYPTERLSWMLEDAQVRVLLTQQQLLEKLSGHQGQVVCLDTEAGLISQSSQDNAIAFVQATNLAYVIYTSGSTGKPKGVVISHEAIAYHCSIIQQTYALVQSDRVLQFASINFDASLEQIFPTLIAGATLVLRGSDVWTATNFQKIISDFGLTVVNLPTAYWQQLAQEWAKTQVLDTNSQLRLVIVGGDVMLPEYVALWQQSPMSFVRLVNAYGPTETTITATLFEILPQLSQDTNLKKIPIGRPLPNRNVYILDTQLEPVPIGVPGELYIGGAGLAKGYLNRSELTQEKFILNPFKRSRGAGEHTSTPLSNQGSRGETFNSNRLYKTGDLARYLSDGNIEYLGRIDNQVKIRGFRIELGEIEAVLSQYSHVQACCAIASEDAPGDKRLVVYIVPHSQVTLIISELRQFLKGKLPEYMVPSAIVILDALPLTPNGKVDRRDLPAPDFQSERIDKYVAPRSPIEEMLAQIWAQVLKVERIGIHDNFFELGGHSLLATQLVSRIRSIFKVELPLRELFARSTVAELAQTIGQLQQKNLELVSPPILPRAREAELPLSFAQKRLWFLDQLEINSAIYNIPLALRLVGTLRVTALEQSLQEIIHRHEALRTNFITVDGKPAQIIQTQTNWTVSVIDWQDVPITEQEIALQQLAQQKAIQPFDLASEALIKATLVILSETEHTLLVCMHHVVSDGWSMGVFIQELAALYNAYSQGQPSTLAPLPIQYADFAIWQRNWLQGDVLQTQLSYWQQQLAGAPALLSLPTDRTRPAVQTFTGAYQEFALSLELTSKLTQLSQEQGVTLFMTLLAAFDTLLYRYTGTEDILVGSPIANRNHSEIEGLIGFFVNTLVMRTNLAGNPSFSELLTRVREMAMDAYSHQDLPFEMLVEALQLQRDLSHTPLFQVMFVLQNAPMQQVELTGLSVSPLLTESATAKFDLTLGITNTATGLVGVWEYNTDLFDASTIERMTGHFLTLLEGIIANPNERISELPLLTEVEQQQLLVEWNDTQVDYPLDKSIHQLFEEQVDSTPDAIAVVYENQQLTYRQLNNRANQLAHYLKSLGVKADILVGICVERSIEMLVGLLGILKAGGAYVPLDPDYPQQRLAFMLNDAALPVVLTQQSLLESLPEHTAQVVCLDSDRQLIAQHSPENPLTGSKPENLAYVIYTSGSTGKPKGVQVSHNGVVNFLASLSLSPGLTDSDTFCAVTTISFDIAALELYLPLIVGAKIVVVSREVASDGARLLLELQESGTTVMQATPATWQMLLASGLSTQKLGMKLLCGGETLPAKLAHQLLETGSEVWNLYGPTETTIWSSIYQLRNDSKQLEARSAIASGAALCAIAPIGRPIANTQIYILDTQLQPVPIGVPGELYIGGAGLTKGYLNRSELTQEKFIPNPFEGAGGSRLYKTGDLARYLPDGNIEYLGRIDNQVKIRGFRIELGEIETVLSQLGDVQTSCVIAREDIPGDKRLVAYVVPHQHSTLTINELRHSLKAKLPDYMVPNAIVILESLPLTPNGKVDRRALPAPDFQSERIDKYLAPRNPIEELLAQIWAQVLKLELVGIHDNFFELGGHSLLATQLVSRIRSIFKVELPLRELFARPTVAELAQTIGQLQQQDLELVSPPILPRAENAQLPLSFAQQRLWFLDQLEPNSAVYNIPITLRLVGTLNQVALEQSLHEIIARHEALRTNFVIVDGKPSQIIQTQTNWTVCVVDWRDVPITEQEIATEQLAQQQAIQPFDLAREPLVRATLVMLSLTEHILLVCMHHVVSDAWSIGVFVEELAALYNAYSQGQRSSLAPLAIQYADFAIWQRNWLQGDVLQSQLSYWQQQLAGAPALLSLPTDRPRPAVQSFAGAYQEFALSLELTDRLTKLSQEQGVTLFMTLLAAFDTLLYRYTGTEDILVGTPIANRNHSEIEGLIGFFVNTLVMRTNLAANPSFSELLGRVRLTAMDAYSHQDLPFEMLVEALQPERDLSHTPLFQVMFVIQNTPMSSVELAGLTISSLPVQSATAKFDLSLSMHNSTTSTTLSTSAGLVAAWEYNTDLFDADTIARMTGHFVTLLEGIVANPHQQISQLPMLTQVEQQQLLVEWNSTQVDYPFDKCIHQLFEEQVERTPHAVAVVLENQQLTYQQLNSQANQLADYLRSLGVGADVLVGLCVERSPLMVVALLGILKAGGAYVPLDPEYPQERLQFMLADTQVKVLLTQEKLLESLPQHQARVVCLDTDWQVINQANQDNLNSTVSAENLSYVIYTSGSTGTPKGVAVTHQAVNRLVLNTNYIQLTSDDCVAQAANIAFDAATFEIWGALLHGAKLVIITKSVLLTPKEFAVNLRSYEVSVLFLTTALFNQLASLIPQAFGSLRYLLFGGEAVDPRWVQEVLDKGRPQYLLHVYGPTENTTFSSWYFVDKLTTTATTIPIGRAISNTQIYLLDQNLQPVPIGIPGELYLAGAGLARGYLNRPELTQEKFIPNPFEEAGGSKLYKTGDLVRYLPDGNIEYLGRIDNQVKIRGFRIELGEIETVLNQHGEIQVSCVIARVDTPGETCTERLALSEVERSRSKQLVAYIVPQKDAILTTGELRQFVKTKLPEYMVPSAFVILEALPLTPNGKVDRRALPTPELDRDLLDKYVAPRTQVEEILTQIWASVLKVELVGIHDNFFELGGDSILSIQIIARANQLGIVLSPKLLFMHQTISELAAVAGTTGAIAAEQGLVTGVVPLTPIQHWFFEQNLPQPHHFNQSFLLSVPSECKPEQLEQVVQYLVLHHDALRLGFVKSESEWQQIHAVGADNTALSWFDLSTLSATEQTNAIETIAAQLQASLNLSKGLMRVAFFSLGIDKRARLLIVLHHLVVDGVSWRILLEDLQTAYQQIAQGKALALPAKTTSFKDWSYKLRQYAQSQALKSEVAYWLNESRFAVFPIPVDYTQGANTVASASTVSVSLNEAQTRALLQDVPKAYNTQINDVLLTALVLVLSKWTNSSSVLFNLEGHGREDIIDGVDLSRTIGWFTTIFPVLVELGVTDNPVDALKSVKEQLRAIPNKGIGYGLLRYLSQDAEIAAQLQAFGEAEISFNYLGQFDQLLNTSSWMQMASESAGNSQSLDGDRAHLLDIISIISGERLQINWTYSTNVHQYATIESLAQEFVKTLQRLIADCSSGESGGYTPSDFPLIKLNQLELDQLLASFALKQELGQTNWQNIEDIYPLSNMQQGMLFESLYAPNSGVYFEQLSCSLNGKLNVTAFEQAWQQLVAKHSILRTAFVWEQLAQPLQVVYRQVDVNLQIHDWQELSAQEQQQQLEVFLHSQRQQGFQLSQAPLMHLDLIQLDADNYQFIWSFHHLLLDGWSVPLVFKDLLYFYQAFSEGESLTEQPTTRSYRNYIAWLQKQDLALAEQFWRQKLQGFTAPTPLNVDKPSSNRKQLDSSYSEERIQFTVQGTATVQTFAQQHKLTINNLVQATWALLLCRYSQETDVVFGATVSGRPPSLVGIESIVGIFINTLPVRVQVSADTELLTLLKDLQAQQVESEQYSYSSLVEIQGLSDVNRGTPLFESIVVFENYPVDVAVESPSYNFSIDKIHTIEQTNYPLTVIVVPGEQLFVRIIYDTSRFDDVAITRMLGHFQTLLEGIVANPKERISQLPMLTQVEQQQLLIEWNDTQAEYSREQCIHQLFEEQVERTPDAIAVEYENQQLTYYELNCRANQLAHYLKSLGVSADVLVGICVERSIEMVVGLLGILKAGGAYVPLDPNYPQERLAFMLEDAQVSVLLTQQGLVDKLPQHQAHLVFLDTDWQLISQSSQDNLISGVEATNLAYVIYTSGSTGQPKGVALNQLALCNLILWQLQNNTISGGAKTLQFAPISFDVSFQEMFSTWFSGGTLFLIREELRRDPVALLDFLQQKAVERLFVPFVALQQLAEVAVDSELVNSHLREIITAGEQLQITPAISQWFSKLNDCTLHNHYGPSESHVIITFSLANPVETWPLLPPIGRPIANTQIYILDKYLQPVPVGVPGELHIGGVSLARGYLNRPELTGEKFIPNPFGGGRGAEGQR
ncbi:non-ribosomal peptide synthase/polyketide synthase, partial [Nostocales cyanobacterium LEGE 12452]|nr:non-ribosomal peptide synthase/polyketide synthase [Nostocales cyanobacterium LEGE 12452]